VRELVVAATAALVFAPTPQYNDGGPGPLVVVLDGASLPDLLAVPELRALASHGGAALMNGRTDVRVALDAAERDWIGAADASDAAVIVRRELALRDGNQLVIVVSASPSAATAADGDELGAVIVGSGERRRLLEDVGPPRALTSDSTRRVGVVATEDPAATATWRLGLEVDRGSPIHTTAEPAPLDLYERYLQQRRLAVPIAAAAWGFVTLAGLIGVLAFALHDRLSPRVFAIAGWLAASLPWLALALLLVGHLPSLTYASVIPFLVTLIVAGVAFSRWLARRRGVLVAIAGTGAAILAILAVEAALGWPAAITPLAGGGQLDGGRFFGMPNIEIGLVLGSALFVAHRIGVREGFLLLIAAALVVGSPWTGSNFGAAITLFAAAGLWLGLRRRRPWWGTAVVAFATTAVGMTTISLLHRYASDRATHVTAFFERTSGIGDALERLLDRLRIGLDQLADTPFAAIPVVGTLLLLVVILRPPAPIARSFEGHDAWRDAALTIVLGSIVAYLANDTGAAALGFGFGFAMSGVLDVSLTSAQRMMRR
jgi:hypothetical protein